MNSLVTGDVPNSNTMNLRSITKSIGPEVSFISDEDFKRFVPTGISVRINTPLVKTGSSPLFAVNVDGMIPNYNVNNSASRFRKYWLNFFPVQAFSNSLTSTQIYYEQNMLPELAMYLSHRAFGGNVGVGIRVTSNTTQTGNFLISQISGAIRHYYDETTPYTGLRFLNTSALPINYAVDSFILADTSLNRNVSITPIRRDIVRITDLQKKIQELVLTPANQITEPDRYNVIASQFAEDWLVFTPLTDLPDATANQLTFTFFFDYSRVQFYIPWMPIIPTPPYNYSRQIANISDTFSNPAFNTQLQITWVGSELTDEVVEEEDVQ